MHTRHTTVVVVSFSDWVEAGIYGTRCTHTIAVVVSFSDHVDAGIYMVHAVHTLLLLSFLFQINTIAVVVVLLLFSSF